MEHRDESQTVRLGRAIRKRRKRLGMTQEEFAERLGLAHQSLSRIEQGRIAPKMDRLPLIAQNLQCSVADLFRENEDVSSYGDRLDDLMTGLSEQKREFIYHHISGLVFLLKMDNACKS